MVGHLNQSKEILKKNQFPITKGTDYNPLSKTYNFFLSPENKLTKI